MVIKFEIQVDGSYGASAIQAQTQADPSLPVEKELPAAFRRNPGGDPPVNDPRSKGGDPPVNDPRAKGGSLPPASAAGTVLVIGPIVICGSGSGHTAFGGGGDPPVNDPRSKGK